MMIKRRKKKSEYKFSRIKFNMVGVQKLHDKKTSLMQYKRIINHYLNVYLGDMKVCDFTIQDILKCIENMKCHLSNKTLQDNIVTLKGIIKYGNTLGYCHIPLEVIPNIKYQKKEMQILSNQELQLIEDYIFLDTDQKKIGLMICLYTGIRLGEICALTWEDIDLENRKIVINKTIHRINEKGKSYISIGTPKTVHSKRFIPIHPHLYHFLLNKRQNSGYILTGNDKYLDPRSYQYYFKKVLKELHIQDYKFHVLRHTFATKCVQCQIDVKSLSEILGYSSVTITLNTYVHSSFEMKKTEMVKYKLF